MRRLSKIGAFMHRRAWFTAGTVSWRDRQSESRAELAIEVFDEVAGQSDQIALFPEDRLARICRKFRVRVRDDQMVLRIDRGLHVVADHARAPAAVAIERASGSVSDTGSLSITMEKKETSYGETEATGYFRRAA